MSGYLCDDAGEPYNAETFDLNVYLAQFDPEWLASAAGRRELTRDDPLLFAVTYVPDKIKNHDGKITFSDIHLGLYRDALYLRYPASEGGDRRAYAAPRNSGKSTTVWLITNLWLACHHPCFVAAFSDTGTQATDHLQTLRTVMSDNLLVRLDYPQACHPKLSARGTPVSDTVTMYSAENGFSFSARGMSTGVLGLVDPDNRRPAVILIDDLEGQEGSGYSLYQASQDLMTLTEGILPMNDRAHVRVIGTVHLAGGILDDLVRSVTTNDPPARWLVEERFKVTYFPPIPVKDDGTRRSCWPGKWTIEFLTSIESTRAFAKSFLNQPLGADGDYWTESDITYGDVPAVTRRILVIDPAVTSKRSSDRTGIAIVAYSPTDGRCLIEHAEGIRLTGGPLRNHLAKLIKRHPGKIHGCLVETNQGGDLWVEVLGPLDLRVLTTHADESKEERFALVLDLYQKPRPLVVHAAKFQLLESEMTGFPKYATDDVADAVVTGVIAFLKPTEGRRVSATVESYR
jgi:phage terminase large subunit-like protein